MDTAQNTPKADYQQDFSKRTIKNYGAALLSPMGYSGLSAMLFSTYLTYVYTEYLGVAAAAIAAVVSVGIIIDGVTDFLMGLTMDRVISRWGKAKHWFFISALPVAVSMVLIWMVPEKATSSFKLVWAFITYNLFCTVLTTIRTPGQAIPALVTDNVKVRVNVAYVEAVAMGLASALVGWIVTPMLNSMGQSLATYRLISVVCAAGTLVTLLVSGVLLKEQRGKKEWDEVKKTYAAVNDKEKESIMDQFRNLLKNRYWIHYLIVNILQSAGTYFVFGVVAYWVEFIAGDASKIGILMTALNIPNLVGAAAYIFLARKLDTRTMNLWAVAVQAVTAIGMWIVGAKLWTIMLVLLFIKSFAGGVTTPACLVILPQIVDYGEWKTGSRQEGLCSAGFDVINKIMSALATAITGFVLTATGYAGGGVAPDAALKAIDFLFMGIPAITLVLCFIGWITFKLDDKMVEQCRKEVAERHAKLNEENAES